MPRIAVSPSSSPSQQCSVVISPNLPLLPRFPVSRASTELISQKNTPKHTHFSKWIHMTEMALAADTVRGPWASWPLHVPHSPSRRHLLPKQCHTVLARTNSAQDRLQSSNTPTIQWTSMVDWSDTKGRPWNHHTPLPYTLLEISFAVWQDFSLTVMIS